MMSVETCTSLHENILDTSNFIDIPGHLKLRWMLAKYLGVVKVAGIIFCIDSTTIGSYSQDTTEYLIEILGNATLSKKNVKLMFACTKSESILSLAPEKIKDLLEAQM